MSANAQYEQHNDFVADAPTGNPKDNDYVSRNGQSTIPVQNDEAPVEDPIDGSVADSDQQLGEL